MDAALSARRLSRLGAWGIALTLVVVAASALLRLGTTLDAGGNVSAELSAGLQRWVRPAHRLAASGVAIVALLAVVVAFASRPVGARRFAVLAAIAGLTTLLAILGPLTPGYGLAAVTIANAVGGIALACAFAWLDERASPFPARTVSLVAMGALALVLAHGALGTAASAAAMHGERGLDPWHVASGPVVVAVATCAAGFGSRSLRAPALRWTVFGAALAQMALGMMLAALPASRVASWSHAMGAFALALALAALAARAAGTPRAPASSDGG